MVLSKIIFHLLQDGCKQYLLHVWSKVCNLVKVILLVYCESRPYFGQLEPQGSAGVHTGWRLAAVPLDSTLHGRDDEALVKAGGAQLYLAFSSS